MKEGFVVSFDVKSSQEDVFESLEDAEQLEKYTDTVRVAMRGQGENSRCYLNLREQVLSIPTQYTVRMKMVEYEPPERMRWQMTNDLDITVEMSVQGSGDSSRVEIQVEIDTENSNLAALPSTGNAELSEIVKYIYPKFQSVLTDVLEGFIQDTGGEPETDVRFSDVSSAFQDVLD